MSRRRTTSIDDLEAGLRAADRRIVARLISLVEDGAGEASEVLRRVYGETRGAETIGMTGPPGAGKSTLIDGLITPAKEGERRVGVLLVDPTSPFSQGAFLGDRARMQSHTLDEAVFIRSMATRGHLGGLSLAVPEAVRILEAANYDVVLIETVGVGQSEVEVARQADTTVVVVAPGMGDAIQAAKAGVLEIADVFCVNRADKDGARQTVRDLRQMIEMGAPRDRDWPPPIVTTVATTGEGLGELWDAVQAHKAHLAQGDRLALRRADRVAAEITEIVGERLKDRLAALAGPDKVGALVERVVDRRLDPYSAADELMRSLGLPTS